MKRLYLILLALGLVLALTLTGCNKKEEADKTPIVKPPVENPKDDVVVEEDEDTLIEEFADILDKEEEPDKIISFIDNNLDKLGELEGDIMIDGLEKKLIENEDSTTDKIFELDKNNEIIEIWENNNYEFGESQIGLIKDNDLKAELQKSYDNMYKLVNLEGQFFNVIDYARLQKYNDYLTDEWKDYLAIMARDSEDLPMADGGLRISYDELAKRLILTENYLNSYVEGGRREEMLELYENKIDVYLKGVPNTPIADRDTNIITDEVLSSYEKTANIENYITSHIVFKYLEAITENENIIDEDILNFADRLVDEAMDILTEYK